MLTNFFTFCLIVVCNGQSCDHKEIWIAERYNYTCITETSVSVIPRYDYVDEDEEPLPDDYIKWINSQTFITNDQP